MIQVVFNIFAFCKRYLLTLLIITFYVVGASGQSSNIVYLEWDDNPLRTIVVNWLDEPTSELPRVEYRKKNSSSSWQSKTGDAINIPDTTIQRRTVKLSGLTPGSSYEFRIPGYTSTDHYFKMPPTSLDEPFTFIVSGDIYGYGIDPEEDRRRFRQMAGHAASQNPLFAALGGDLVHTEGYTKDTLHRYFLMLDNYYARMQTQNGGYLIPIIAALGNHDVDGRFGQSFEDAPYFHALFNFPGNRGYGVLDFGNYLSLIILDSNHTNPVEGEQTQWLRQRLQERESVKHVFPIYHVAAWPSSPFRSIQPGRGKEIREQWVPLFEQFGVRFAFEHDNHLYKRTHPLKNEKIDPTGVTYLGDGGWGVRPIITADYWFLADTRELNYVVRIDISDSFRKSTAIDQFGRSVDDFLDIIFLAKPVIGNPEILSETSFRLNWNSVQNATEYRLDVSTDMNFQSFVDGYESRFMGTATTHTLRNLQSNDTYFARVRARTPTISSNYSEVKSIRLVALDPALSTINSSERKLQANNFSNSRVVVTAVDVDGEPISGVEVELIARSGNLIVESNNLNTDEDGKAYFLVKNDRSEVVSYGAIIRGREINQTVEIEYIPIDKTLSSVSVSADKVLANGVATSKVSVIARDEDGNPFRNVEMELFSNSEETNIENVQSKTDSNGLAIFNVSNRIAETVTYTSQGMGVAIEETATVKFVSISFEESSTSINKDKIIADGEDKLIISVIAKDEDGDRVKGAISEIVTISGNPDITALNSETDEEGEAHYEITNKSAEIVVLQPELEGKQIGEKINISFIPPPPVILAATNVKSRSFIANWETINESDTYFIDVAKDSIFLDNVNNYNQLDIGKVTSYEINELNPGTEYYVRVFAFFNNLKGAYSDTLEVLTFPVEPIANLASSQNALEFTANWQESIGAESYLLDVSEFSDFRSTLSGYDDKEVDNELSHTIAGLEPGKDYYYRVKSKVKYRESSYSNVIQTSTLQINTDNSEITSQQDKVLANGSQEVEISVQIKSAEKIPLKDLNIDVISENGVGEVNYINRKTDDSGIAKFTVKSNNEGKDSFRIESLGNLIGNVEIEFLNNEGKINLGDNFPNPFQQNTIIPLTLPTNTFVKLVIYNSIGSPIQTVINEQMNSGYYEIPFITNGIASGIYFYRLTTSDKIITKKMTLTK